MTKINKFLAGCLLAVATTAVAQDAEAPAGPRGGAVRQAGGVKVEVAFDREGVQVFVIGADDRAVDLREASGKVELRFEDAGRVPLAGELKASSEGGPQRLQARLDGLSGLAEGQAKMTVSLAGVPGVDGGSLTVEVPFRLARLTEYVCPMRCVPATAEPGDCPKCHMDLVAAPFIYACPMHPQVTSRDPAAKCWSCKMDLTKRADGEAGKAQGGCCGGDGGH